MGKGDKVAAPVSINNALVDILKDASRVYRGLPGGDDEDDDGYVVLPWRAARSLLLTPVALPSSGCR